MDFWDWLRGLRTWWWILVVFPLIALGISWLNAPEPKYETKWTVNIYFDDPPQTNVRGYIDSVFLDDLGLLMKTGVLGDVMYLRLPEEIQAAVTREEFGDMVESSRKAHFVEITVSGDDPDHVRIAAETIDENLQEIANHYLVPPTYRGGEATVNTLDEIVEPALNNGPPLVFVGSITLATVLVSVAATGVAEWLRLSYRAKYSVR